MSVVLLHEKSMIEIYHLRDTEENGYITYDSYQKIIYC